MGLTKYKLGELIELSDERNSEGVLTIEDVRGISNTKEIMRTKADVDEYVIKKFYIVRPGQFIYNPRTTRMGDKVGLAYNDQEKPLLFSFNNIAFTIKESVKNIILPHYLYIYFNRSEFDRYAITNSWGSATELFSFEEMCDISILLPDKGIQQKYVDVYLAMQNNLAVYENKVSDLKLVCDAYIEDLRRKTACVEIGKYCVLKNDCRNKELKCNNVRGVKITKELAETKADIDENSSLTNYKLVEPGEIVYVPNTARMGDKIACALSYEFCCVSPIYEIIQVDSNKLIPEYLFMWFRRQEFDRYARFNSWGSVRESIDWETLKLFSIPIPSIEIQKSIVDIYKCYIERKSIFEQLKVQIKDICPILIKGSLQTNN